MWPQVSGPTAESRLARACGGELFVPVALSGGADAFVALPGTTHSASHNDLITPGHPEAGLHRCGDGPRAVEQRMPPRPNAVATSAGRRWSVVALMFGPAAVRKRLASRGAGRFPIACRSHLCVGGSAPYPVAGRKRGATGASRIGAAPMAAVSVGDQIGRQLTPQSTPGECPRMEGAPPCPRRGHRAQSSNPSSSDPGCNPQKDLRRQRKPAFFSRARHWAPRSRE